MRRIERAATARCLLAAAVALGCTNPDPARDDAELFLRFEVRGDGALGDVAVARVPRGALTARAATTRGEVLVEQLDGDEVAWSGHRYVSYYGVSEVFGPTDITGELVAIDVSVQRMLLPDPGGDEVTLRFSITPPGGGAPEVTERTVVIPETDTGSSTGGLVEHEADDVAGRREGLCLSFDAPLLSVDTCDDEHFCNATIGGCEPEACIPDDTWDGELVEVVAGSDYQIVLLPYGWDDPDAFEENVRGFVESMQTRIDWYADNPGRVGFSVWRQRCEVDGHEPDPGDRAGLVAWLDELPEQTGRLPGADGYVVLGEGDTCTGWAYFGGPHAAITRCADTETGADLLAHELGHLIAHLRDEYSYSASDTASCAAGSAALDVPNLAAADDPSWFCEADTGEVYAGQDCGGASGGVVGGFVEVASYCSNSIARPCESSIMRAHWDNQFDPVGEGAMTYALDTGERMGYVDCDEGCSDDCSEYAAGTCGLNGCFQICNACDTGQRCGGATEVGYLCRDECAPGAASCRSNLGFDFCDGETALTTDGACDGYRLASCDDGTIVPMGCVM